MPSGELRTPASPATTISFPEDATAFKFPAPGGIEAVQVMASGERTMVPPSPTATNCVPVQATAKSWFVVGVVALIQPPPVDVRILPTTPTATSFVPDHATPKRSTG